MKSRPNETLQQKKKIEEEVGHLYAMFIPYTVKTVVPLRPKLF